MSICSFAISRWFVIGFLILAALRSAMDGLADCWSRSERPALVRRAVALAPHDAGLQVRWARLSGDQRAWNRAASLNPRDARVWMELGLQAEERADYAFAQYLLEEAANVDKTFLPAWTLANYHFRRGNRDAFWPQARAAFAVAENRNTQLAPLFAMCWRLSTDGRFLLDKVVPHSPQVLTQYLYFLLDGKEFDGASEAAEHLALFHRPDLVIHLLVYCDRLLADRRFKEAASKWDHFIGPRHGLVNADFAAPISNLAFDWRTPNAEGVTFSQFSTNFVTHVVEKSVENPVENPLRFELSGKQPERAELLQQWMVLSPGARYRLRFDSRCSGSGLSWRVFDAAARELARRDLPASEEWTSETLEFTVPQSGAARLSLVYAREPGATRMEGAVWLRALYLEPIP